MSLIQPNLLNLIIYEQKKHFFCIAENNKNCETKTKLP